MIRYFLVILLTFVSFSFTADLAGDNIRVVGWVFDPKDRPIRDAEINVYRDDSKIDELETNRRGMFDYDMTINNYYVFEITAPGKAPKKFAFNTEIPGTFVGVRGLDYEFVMDLFSNYPGLELDVFDKVLLEFYFDESEQGFSFDQGEYESVFNEIEEARAYIEELYDKKDDYDDIVRSADRLYGRDNLEEALELYYEADNLNIPGETRASEQIIAISRKLGIHTEDEIRRYEELIVKGDEKFDEENFETAIDYYMQSLDYMPDESYPVDRIEECERLIAEMTVAEKEEPEVVEDDIIVEAEPVEEVVPEPEPEKEVLAEEEVVEEEEPIKDVSREITEIAEKETEVDVEKTVVEEKLTEVEIRKPGDYILKEWELTDEQENQLQQMADKLKSDPSAKLVITSFVILEDDDLYNFYLSKKQATAAIHYLLNLGIDINRLHQISYSDEFHNVTRGDNTLEFEIKSDPEFRQLVQNSHKNSLIYLNDLSKNSEFASQVEFLVQFVAAVNPVSPEYYKTITDYFPDKNIYYYYGEQRLHHYSVGSIRNLSMALEVHRDLRTMGYDTYIIAFLNGNRVLTAEISELLNSN